MNFPSHSQKLSERVRLRTLEMVYEANASHIGSALSIVDMLSVLYSGVIKYKSNEPLSPERDRLILSKGHACSALYATLAEVGFFGKDLLKTFGKDGSILMNHASHLVPGVEFSTGSLGHGLPFAVGIALHAMKAGLGYKVYVIVSDGELNEGSTWEAVMLAAHYKLDNIILMVDYNKLQSLGSTEDTLGLEPLSARFSSFNWEPILVDGHCHTDLADAMAQPTKARPRVLICNTIKGYGISFMENKVEWHYKCPTKQEFEAARRELLMRGAT